jgi:hypothetical protein
MNYTTFKHSGNAGDIIYSLNVVKQYCQANNTKCNYLIALDVPSTFTEEQHPVGAVMMNQAMYDLLKPLLEAQDYIRLVDVYTDQDITFDLDLFRQEYRTLSAGNIQCWYSNAYPELRVNLEEPCINIHPIKNDFVIINRTTRYNNNLIDYTILEGDVRFVGVESEFELMRAVFPEIKHLVVKDFNQLAQYIAGCKLYVGNQSMAFAIAEQLKVRRVLEQYVRAPNVIPSGGEYYSFHTQKQFGNIIKSIKFV